MIIDSHVHFWKYSKQELPWIDRNMKILQKDYLPSELALTLKRNDIDGCIAVQAATAEVETRFLAELAKTNPLIKGVVGWTDLRANDAEKKLTELKTYSSIVGLRHIVQTEPDDFLYDEKFRAGISLLRDFEYTYDILIFPRQLTATLDFIRAFPQQTFILDHCGKPEIKNKEMEHWRKGITDLAMFPNVSCKLSGLITEAEWKEWSPGDFYPYLDVVFESFGTERLMFGSDWPVMLLSGIYVQWKSLLERYMEKYLPEEKEAVFGLNALKTYKLI
ncbi:MAG TPA: amidohydrolase family protein [Flavitalea sp.]|nr:amidohydrolase family protein [Flavitalea sp.]